MGLIQEVERQADTGAVPRGDSFKRAAWLAPTLLALSLPAAAAVGPFGFIADSAVRIVDLRNNQTYPNTVIPNDTVAAFALNQAGTKLFELYSLDGGIGVRDLSTNKYADPVVKKGVLSVVAATTGGGMAITPDDSYLLVATGSELDVVSVSSGAIVKRIDKLLNVINPVDVKIPSTGGVAYVSDQCGGVAVISLSSWNVTKTIDLAPGYLNYYSVANKCQTAVRPTSLQTDAKGYAYVLDSASGTVSRLSPDTGTATSVNIGGTPRRLAVNTDGSKLYVGFYDLNKIAVINLSTFANTGAINTASPVIDLAPYKDGSVYGVFDKQTSSGEYWLAQIDSNDVLTNKLQTVPATKRLFVADLATDLNTVFYPSSVTPSPDGAQQSTSTSTGGGGGGGGGCTIGGISDKTDPLLPVLALVAAVSAWWSGRRKRA